MSWLQLLSKSVRFLLSILLISLIVLLAACSGTPAESTRSVTITNIQVNTVVPTQPYPFKTSEPGHITIHGELVVTDPMVMLPAEDDAIYLVPIPEDQPLSTIPTFEPGTVPQADVDETIGEFVFTNIEPGQYAVVVETVSGAQFPAHFYQKDSYAIFKVDASQVDKTYELGLLSLP